MIFGARYESDAVVADGSPPPKVDNPVTDYTPTARPGSRAPHVWVERDGAQVSILDLLGGQQFTVLAGADGRAWCDAARAAADRLRVPLGARVISGVDGPADEEGRWPATYAIEDDGAVLIRPDGYVGWRRASASSDPSVELISALEHILGRARRSTT
jgi:putative polyketide hydroxylase